MAGEVVADFLLAITARQVKTREAHHHCLSTLFAPQRDRLIETGISAW